MNPPRRVIVTAPSPDWPRAFRDEAAALRPALGPALMALHHIGSTAVPGLAAKPTIDILGVVTGLAAARSRETALAALGYVARGASGLPGRLYFRKTTGADRTHHLHLFAQGDAHIARHLAFRDYLTAHPDEARDYGALKTALAAAHPEDIQAYMEGKAAMCEALNTRAQHWASNLG